MDLALQAIANGVGWQLGLPTAVASFAPWFAVVAKELAATTYNSTGVGLGVGCALCLSKNEALLAGSFSLVLFGLLVCCAACCGMLCGGCSVWLCMRQGKQEKPPQVPESM